MLRCIVHIVYTINKEPHADSCLTFNGVKNEHIWPKAEPYYKTEVVTNDPSAHSNVLLLFPNAQFIKPSDGTLWNFL